MRVAESLCSIGNIYYCYWSDKEKGERGEEQVRAKNNMVVYSILHDRYGISVPNKIKQTLVDQQKGKVGV